MGENRIKHGELKARWSKSKKLERNTGDINRQKKTHVHRDTGDINTRT